MFLDYVFTSRFLSRVQNFRDASLMTEIVKT